MCAHALVWDIIWEKKLGVKACQAAVITTMTVRAHFMIIWFFLFEHRADKNIPVYPLLVTTLTSAYFYVQMVWWEMTN